MQAAIQRTKDEIVAMLSQQIPSKRLSDEVQLELGLLLGSLRHFNKDKDLTAIQTIKIALEGLLTDNPSLVTARTLRHELEGRLNLVKHPIRWIILGGSPSVLVMLGLISVLFIVFFFIFKQHETYAAAWSYLGFGEKERILTLIGMSGAIGSIVSILLRISNFAEKSDAEGWKGEGWALYLTGLTKPLVGTFAGWFVYFLHQVGMIPLKIDSGTELFWYAVLGFVSGFSERLFKDLGSEAESKVKPALTTT